MSNTYRIEYHITPYSRHASIHLAGRPGESISVYQKSGYQHWAGQTSLEAVNVHWGSFGSQGLEISRQFAQALQAAIQIAETWEQDTGKLTREVLKAPEEPTDV